MCSFTAIKKTALAERERERASFLIRRPRRWRLLNRTRVESSEEVTFIRTVPRAREGTSWGGRGRTTNGLSRTQTLLRTTYIVLRGYSQKRERERDSRDRRGSPFINRTTRVRSLFLPFDAGPVPSYSKAQFDIFFKALLGDSWDTPVALKVIFYFVTNFIGN